MKLTIVRKGIDLKLIRKTAGTAGESGVQTYPLTIQAPTNGEIVCNNSTGDDIAINTIVPIYAKPNTGYRFVRWLINSIENLVQISYTKITAATTIIAEFIAQFTLTVNQPTNGTLNTDKTPGIYDDGTQVNAELIPDQGYTGTIHVNDIDSGETSLTVTMTEDKTLSAVIAAILQTFQDVFSSIPIKIVDNWYFSDDSGNSNNVKINQIPYLLLVGNTALNYKLPESLNGKTSLNIEMHIIPKDLTGTQWFFIYGAASGSGIGGAQIAVIADKIYIYVDDGQGVRTTSTVTLKNWSTMVVDQLYKIEFKIDLTAKTVQYILDDVLIQQFSIPTIAGTFQNTPDPTNYLRVASTGSGLKAGITYLHVENICESYFQEMYDSKVVNTYNNATEKNGYISNYTATLRDNYLDSLEPVNFSKGCSIYKDDSNNYLALVYDRSGNPATLENTGNWTKLGDFPAASGILIGLIHLYEWPDNEDIKALLTTEGIYDMHGNAIQVDFDTVKAITTTEQIIKTETANNVNQLILKQ